MFNKPTSELGLLNILLDLSSTTKCEPQIIPLMFVNLVTPKAGAKHELL
jgi:hypothetical protein